MMRLSTISTAAGCRVSATSVASAAATTVRKCAAAMPLNARQRHQTHVRLGDRRQRALGADDHLREVDVVPPAVAVGVNSSRL